MFALVVIKTINREVENPGGKPNPNARFINKTYESEWHDANRALEDLIRKEMKEQHFPNYLDIYMKRSHEDRSFIIACTNDGEHFNYYTMDIGSSINKVVDDGIKKPKALKY